MTYISTVEVDPLMPDRFAEVLSRASADQLREALGRAATAFQGRVIWNVNSTASRIGGIQDQITHGETGLLLDDPTDLEGFGAAVLSLLADDRSAAEIGAAGMERVRSDFLANRSLLRYMDLMGRLIGEALPHLTA